MPILKPFFRITVLSMILASLLIYLGVKYHWGETLKNPKDVPTSLTLPEQTPLENTVSLSKAINTYSPVIVKNNQSNTLLESMNKEQITEHCVNLLSRQLKEPLSLELATVNCVVSNYQETFQNNDKEEAQTSVSNDQNKLIKNQCQIRYKQNNQLSVIDKELLIGICISDSENQN